MASLDDALHKLERGKEQLKQLRAEFEIAFNKDAIQVEINSHPIVKPAGITDPRMWIAYTASFAEIPIVPKRCGILIGEVVQTFRSSLDYLAWAFAVRYRRGLTEGQKRSIYFPIAWRPKYFGGKLDKIIPAASPEQRAFFERYQPYRRTNEGWAIRYLERLSTRDKHRVIIPALMWPAEGEIKFDFTGADQVGGVPRMENRREIKKGAKIGTIILAGGKKGERKVNVNVKAAFAPMFQKSLVKPRPPYEIAVVDYTLCTFRDVCAEIIAEARNYF